MTKFSLRASYALTPFFKIDFIWVRLVGYFLISRLLCVTLHDSTYEHVS